ncbi:MAG: Signal transduction histidine-protein kinase AtoS [Ignavibacteria bacterium]|nr:Signal transduction histidine-protein kinase AtoS [Ignavibacteria bacterium]
MESRVILELEKSIQNLKSDLKEKFDLRDEIINSLSNEMELILSKLINLMKEGKSAHEKFFSDIILNSVDAIIGLDNEFKIFLWNKGAERLFGYAKNEVIGKDFSILMPDYFLKKGEREFLINEVKSKGFLANYESERITKSGEIKKVSIARFMVNDEKNEPIGSVGIVRDITHIKNLERDLREKENLALIGEVVSSIAHSLSNPLNIISGNADYLLFSKKEGENQYEELKTILDETTKITKSIRHLLNFSRPLNTNKSKNQINIILKKILAEIKYQTVNKKIKIKEDLKKDLPEIEIDEVQIEECINNIITNAVQAIQTTGEIKVKTNSNGEFITLEISDTGQGISEENISKIFMPFFSSKEYGKGTGLGLAISKKIINEHKGSINVKSIPGKGTKFIIKLPVN